MLVLTAAVRHVSVAGRRVALAGMGGGAARGALQELVALEVDAKHREVKGDGHGKQGHHDVDLLVDTKRGAEGVL